MKNEAHTEKAIQIAGRMADLAKTLVDFPNSATTYKNIRDGKVSSNILALRVVVDEYNDHMLTDANAAIKELTKE
jgi:hypothetical protein